MNPPILPSNRDNFHEFFGQMDTEWPFYWQGVSCYVDRRLEKMFIIVFRFFSKGILFTCNEYGKKPPTFEDASIVAQGIINSGYTFDQGELYYNEFK